MTTDATRDRITADAVAYLIDRHDGYCRCGQSFATILRATEHAETCDTLRSYVQTPKGRKAVHGS